MKAYKGFNADMTCRGFQYKEGKSYQEDAADLCISGFHACENPIDCLKYYHPADGAVFHEVEVDDVSNRRDDDTKICGKRIHIGARLDLGTLIKAGVQFVFSKVDWEAKKAMDSSTAASQGYSSTAASQGYSSTAASQGNSSTAASQGYSSKAASQGDSSTAASQGNYSKAASQGYSSTAASQGNSSTAASQGNSSTAASQGYSSTAASQGNYSTAASQGDSSKAEVNGRESIAAAFGRGVKAKASKNSWIVLSDIDDSGHIVDVKSYLVDGEKVKADIWYRYKDGNLIEVK